MRLEQWSFKAAYDTGYNAPETFTICLHGRVEGAVGDKAHRNGKNVLTSELAKVHVWKETIVVHTRSGSRYPLGEVRTEFSVQDFLTTFEKIRNIRQKSGRPLGCI